MSDQVPVIATFDIYIHQEATKSQAAGWVRRIILDAWSSPGFTYSGSNVYVQKPTRKEARRDAHDEDILKPDKDAFLYTSGNRVVGKDWSNFVKFAFADLSAVSPKRYHSTRSLGWMA